MTWILSVMGIKNSGTLADTSGLRHSHLYSRTAAAEEWEENQCQGFTSTHPYFFFAPTEKTGRENYLTKTKTADSHLNKRAEKHIRAAADNKAHTEDGQKDGEAEMKASKKLVALGLVCMSPPYLSTALTSPRLISASPPSPGAVRNVMLGDMKPDVG